MNIAENKLIEYNLLRTEINQKIELHNTLLTFTLTTVVANNTPIVATTNLIDSFDKAILRRFDAIVSFDRYSKDDLISVADSMLTAYLKRATNSKQDIRLFNKILKNLDIIPMPGDLKQVIKTAIAFSSESNEYDYLRRIYLSLNGNPSTIDIQKLSDEGYTTREIEILSKMPKSSVSRKLRG